MKKSYDPDGFIISYKWDFGDGSHATGNMAWHSYSSPGNYTVKLKVIDNDGLSDEDITYAIVNITPVADAGGPYFGLVNESIEFDGSNGYAINGTIVLYKRSFRGRKLWLWRESLS